MKRTVREVYTAPHLPGQAPGMAKRIPLMPGRWQDFDPFLLMAEDWFQQPGGFPDHPHRGIETVTLVLDGALHHADNRGNSGVLTQGDIQWMTAGRGIIHAELPHQQHQVHSLQLWVNLPGSLKMMDAGYQDLTAANALHAQESSAAVRVISGKVAGVEAPTRNQVPILLLDVTVPAGRRTVLPVPESHNGFAYLLEGAGDFGANDVRGQAGQVLRLDYPRTRARDAARFEVTAESDLRFLLATGEPIREPVVAHGPFVMCTQEDIHQAYADYRSGHFGGPTPAALALQKANS